VESAMVTALLYLCVSSSYTDFKKSIIPNKSILWALGISAILNIIYYALFAMEFILAFLLNISITSTFIILLYVMHIWSAGDSKLMFAICTLLPSRIFYDSAGMIAPSVWLLVLAFSIGFIYLVFESIIIKFTKRIKGIRIPRTWNVWTILKQYLLCTLYLFVWNKLLLYIINMEFLSKNTSLIALSNLVLVLVLTNGRFYEKKVVFIPTMVIAVVLCIISGFGKIEINLMMIEIAIFVFVLRYFMEEYNYQRIQTENVAVGMVMSATTIALFMPSRIQGLPSNTTEDLRSKITKEEAESIRRWKDSKYGNNEIIIVRKMPFAVFISAATVAYCIMKVVKYVA
jgi:hypothetical protein